MRIVGRVEQILQSCLERIFILKDTIVNLMLNMIQAMDQVDGRLLIAGRRIPQICQCALELYGIIIVADEVACDSSIKGNAGQTIICLFGSEGIIWKNKLRARYDDGISTYCMN